MHACSGREHTQQSAEWEQRQRLSDRAAMAGAHAAERGVGAAHQGAQTRRAGAGTGAR